MRRAEALGTARLAASALVAALVAVACSSEVTSTSAEPEDVSGTYTVSLTNRDTTCPFTGDTWKVGATSTGLPLTITQDGASVTGTVGAGWRVFVELVLGTYTSTGAVDGSDITLTLRGTKSNRVGNCIYTVDATARATLTGDALQGTIVYSPVTGRGSDCVAIEGCTATQAFSGSRPPK